MDRQRIRETIRRAGTKLIRSSRRKEAHSKSRPSGADEERSEPPHVGCYETDAEAKVLKSDVEWTGSEFVKQSDALARS